MRTRARRLFTTPSEVGGGETAADLPFGPPTDRLELRAGRVQRAGMCLPICACARRPAAMIQGPRPPWDGRVGGAALCKPRLASLERCPVRCCGANRLVPPPPSTRRQTMAWRASQAVDHTTLLVHRRSTTRGTSATSTGAWWRWSLRAPPRSIASSCKRTHGAMAAAPRLCAANPTHGAVRCPRRRWGRGQGREPSGLALPESCLRPRDVCGTLLGQR